MKFFHRRMKIFLPREEMFTVMVLALFFNLQQNTKL